MLNIKIEALGGNLYTIVVGEDGTDLMQYTTTSPQRTVQGILREYNIKGKRGVPVGSRRKKAAEASVDVSPN